MGHYDDCRPGYCGGCGAGPGNLERNGGVCPFCNKRSGIAKLAADASQRKKSGKTTQNWKPPYPLPASPAPEMIQQKVLDVLTAPGAKRADKSAGKPIDVYYTPFSNVSGGKAMITCDGRTVYDSTVPDEDAARLIAEGIQARMAAKGKKYIINVWGKK